MQAGMRQIAIRLSEQVLPPHDPLHGTADQVVRRLATIDLPDGHASWEQTDYGHPGRFNTWEPRGISVSLQPRFRQLLAAEEAVGVLLD